jgi:glycosyltransferase involved in cell wall biosynthesis
VANHVLHGRPRDSDVTVTCSYPFVNWMLTRWPPFRQRPAHVFVTQNGDHPAVSARREYRLFRCDGLICTNPIYFGRNRERWPSALVPNGIDPDRFRPGPPERAALGLPDGPIVLMVSALVESKRVLEGMRAVARIPDATLVVAGDGPLRDRFDQLGDELMPGRHRRMTLPADRMPDLYRSADVLLHPTLLESFGNVYIEAMSVGLPVVAHDSGVTRWIMGDGSGLVDTTDEEALTDAVEAALKDGRDLALAAAPAVSQRFAWSSIARQYREFFVDVTEHHDGAL